MESIHQCWAKSRVFRVILIAACVYFALRLTVHIYMAIERMLPGQTATQVIPNDMQDYLEAATRLAAHQPLYSFPSDYSKYYQYPPVFALAMRPLLALPQDIDFSLNFILRLAAFALLYLCWGRIFRRAKMRRAEELWAQTLPVWLVFSAFWSDLVYMNIYIIVALFITLLLNAMLSENLFLSVLWLSLLLQTKPFWAVVALLPLLLGRGKFFLKLAAAGLVVNLLAIGGFLLAVGPAYGWQQHVDYVRFLLALNQHYPWRTLADGFLGYNHSIMQIVVFLLGTTPAAFALAVFIKLLLLVPLAVVCVKSLLRPARQPGYAVPGLALALALALYLGVAIWLDALWEISLGCAIFICLLAWLDQDRPARVILWAVFMPYVFIDLLQIVGYGVLGNADMINGGDYLAADFSIYIPIVMIVVLVFYFQVVRQVWKSLPGSGQAAPAGR